MSRTRTPRSDEERGGEGVCGVRAFERRDVHVRGTHGCAGETRRAPLGAHGRHAHVLRPRRVLHAVPPAPAPVRPFVHGARVGGFALEPVWAKGGTGIRAFREGAGDPRLVFETVLQAAQRPGGVLRVRGRLPHVTRRQLVRAVHAGQARVQDREADPGAGAGRSRRQTPTAGGVRKGARGGVFRSRVPRQRLRAADGRALLPHRLGAKRRRVGAAADGVRAGQVRPARGHDGGAVPRVPRGVPTRRRRRRGREHGAVARPQRPAGGVPAEIEGHSRVRGRERRGRGENGRGERLQLARVQNRVLQQQGFVRAGHGGRVPPPRRDRRRRARRPRRRGRLPASRAEKRRRSSSGGRRRSRRDPPRGRPRRRRRRRRRRCPTLPPRGGGDADDVGAEEAEEDGQGGRGGRGGCRGRGRGRRRHGDDGRRGRGDEDAEGGDE